VFSGFVTLTLFDIPLLHSACSRRRPRTGEGLPHTRDLSLLISVTEACEHQGGAARTIYLHLASSTDSLSKISTRTCYSRQHKMAKTIEIQSALQFSDVLKKSKVVLADCKLYPSLKAS
jgi:hypothetical protein